MYSSLRATVTCDSSILATTGPSFEAKTVAYSSRFLATGILQIPGPGCTEHVILDGFHTVDVNSLYYRPITTTETQKSGCPPYYNPRLSLPAELRSVDPMWANCEPLFYGAFDPPRILKRGDGRLAPILTTKASTTDAESTAAQLRPALGQATPASATPTPTPFAAVSPVSVSNLLGQTIVTTKPEHHSPIQSIHDSESIYIDPDNGALDLATPERISNNLNSDPAVKATKSLPQVPQHGDSKVMTAGSSTVVAIDQDSVRAEADLSSDAKLPATKAQIETEVISVFPSNLAFLINVYKNYIARPSRPTTYSETDDAEPGPTDATHPLRVTSPLVSGVLLDISPTADVAGASIIGSSHDVKGDTSSSTTLGATAVQVLSKSAWSASGHPVESLHTFLVGTLAAPRAGDGTILIGSRIITPDGHATVAGHILSVGPNALVLDSTTHTILNQPSSLAVAEAAEVLSSTSSIVAMTLTSGSTFESDGKIVPYTAASEMIISKPTGVQESPTTHRALITAALASSTAISNESSAPEMLSSGRATASGPANGAGLRGRDITFVWCQISVFVASIITAGCFCFVFQ